MSADTPRSSAAPVPQAPTSPAPTATSTADVLQAPAKWAAVVFLGLAVIGGMGWSIARSGGLWAALSAFNSNQWSVVHTNNDLYIHNKTLPDPGSPISPASRSLDGSAERTSSAESPRFDLVLDLNTATSAELELLPGIGPALAGRIIVHRQRHGPFRRFEDLDDVSGIGPRTLERLRGHVRVLDEATPAPRSEPAR